MSHLQKYRQNIYSQNGEDGIIAELTKRLKLGEEEWFCEFGAWDGKFLSNTFALVERGWRGVEIEGEYSRFEDLLVTAKAYPEQIYPICAYVSAFPGEKSLDTLLAKTPIPPNFGLLSIDIDSIDYHIWESLTNYTPKIVVIEIDSLIQPTKEKIATENSPYSSFKSTVKLGHQKNYTPVAHTGNIIFVRSDLVSMLQLPQRELNNPECLFDYSWILSTESLSVTRKLKRKILSFLKMVCNK